MSACQSHSDDTTLMWISHVDRCEEPCQNILPCLIMPMICWYSFAWTNLQRCLLLLVSLLKPAKHKSKPILTYYRMLSPRFQMQIAPNCLNHVSCNIWDPRKVVQYRTCLSILQLWKQENHCASLTDKTCLSRNLGKKYSQWCLVLVDQVLPTNTCLGCRNYLSIAWFMLKIIFTKASSLSA